MPTTPTTTENRTLGWLATERAAFVTAAGLALLAALSYAVARVTVPLAGLGFGVALLLAVPLGGAARVIVRRAREPGGMRARIILSVPLGLLFAALGFLASTTIVFDRSLPVLAWAGFGIVALVVLALGLVAVALLTGENAAGHGEASQKRARSDDGRYRLLVVADEAFGPDACRSLADRMARRSVVVQVVAPALNSPLRHWTSDEDGARAEAHRRLKFVLAELARVGISASGAVGVDDPLEAIDDELRMFPADEIILVTRSPGQPSWLEEALGERARRLYDVPITELSVDGRVAEGP